MNPVRNQNVNTGQGENIDSEGHFLLSTKCNNVRASAYYF